MMLVRYALKALGHRPDDFKAAVRMEERRASRADELERMRVEKPEQFRRAMRSAIRKGNGVNSKAAKAAGTTVGPFLELVARDPLLASEFQAANVVAMKRRPKTG